MQGILLLLSLSNQIYAKDVKIYLPCHNLLDTMMHSFLPRELTINLSSSFSYLLLLVTYIFILTLHYFGFLCLALFWFQPYLRWEVHFVIMCLCLNIHFDYIIQKLFFKMLNWLHGIAFTLSFYFLADGNPTAVSLIPIFISCCLSVLASIQYLREKRNASLQLATTATATLMLILFFTQPDHIYEIFAATFAVICLLFVFANAHVIFFLAPKWLALANSISFLLTAVLYVLFYASIKKHILDQVYTFH